MSQESILAESAEKLERLRKMPATPIRAREIASLERLIASGAKPEKKVRVSRKKIISGSKRKEIDDLYDDDESEKSSKQARVVEECGTHRRITIIKKAPETYSEKDEEAAQEKVHKQSLCDIQAVLGSTFRGFS